MVQIAGCWSERLQKVDLIGCIVSVESIETMTDRDLAV